MTPSPPLSWTVVVPLKGGPTAKSRLAGAAGSGLAAAIALDTLDAVVACPPVVRVVVVTSDHDLARAAKAADAEVVSESVPGAGLRAAIADGLAAVTDGPTAVLLGDLPALRPADLDQALTAVGRALRNAHEVFVPDAEGSGTVLLAGRSPALTPAFGPGSAAAHSAAGAVGLDLDLPRLRRDVDTDADLALARPWGLGRRTARLVPPDVSGTLQSPLH